MNRQETIKALKICSQEQPCAQCPLNDYASDADKCKQKLMEDALKVIETNTQYHRENDLDTVTKQKLEEVR